MTVLRKCRSLVLQTCNTSEVWNFIFSPSFCFILGKQLSPDSHFWFYSHDPCVWIIPVLKSFLQMEPGSWLCFICFFADLSDFCLFVCLNDQSSVLCGIFFPLGLYLRHCFLIFPCIRILWRTCLKHWFMFPSFRDLNSAGLGLGVVAEDYFSQSPRWCLCLWSSNHRANILLSFSLVPFTQKHILVCH